MEHLAHGVVPFIWNPKFFILVQIDEHIRKLGIYPRIIVIWQPSEHLQVSFGRVNWHLLPQVKLWLAFDLLVQSKECIPQTSRVLPGRGENLSNPNILDPMAYVLCTFNIIHMFINLWNTKIFTVTLIALLYLGTSPFHWSLYTFLSCPWASIQIISSCWLMTCITTCSLVWAKNRVVVTLVFSSRSSLVNVPLSWMWLEGPRQNCYSKCWWWYTSEMNWYNWIFMNSYKFSGLSKPC